MTLAIEGAAAADFGGGASSASISVTTGGPNRVIIVHVSTENNGTPERTVTGVAAAGLTFYLRKTLAVGGGYGVGVETWWANSAAQQTGLSITVTMSGAIDSGTLGVLAVSGVQNPSSPWDSDISLPATNVDTGSWTPVQVPNVSTASPDSIVFGFYGSEVGSIPNAETTPIAFTQAYAQSN